MDFITYILSFLFVIALICALAWATRRLLHFNSSTKIGFLSPQKKRIGMVQMASLDGRRKLMLVRRDDVEHLIMTGGPVDVLIETGISSNDPGSSGLNLSSFSPVNEQSRSEETKTTQDFASSSDSAIEKND